MDISWMDLGVGDVPWSPLISYLMYDDFYKVKVMRTGVRSESVINTYLHEDDKGNIPYIRSWKVRVDDDYFELIKNTELAGHGYGVYIPVYSGYPIYVSRIEGSPTEHILMFGRAVRDTTKENPELKLTDMTIYTKSSAILKDIVDCDFRFIDRLLGRF